MEVYSEAGPSRSRSRSRSSSLTPLPSSPDVAEGQDQPLIMPSSGQPQPQAASIMSAVTTISPPRRCRSTRDVSNPSKSLRPLTYDKERERKRAKREKQEQAKIITQAEPDNDPADTSTSAKRPTARTSRARKRKSDQIEQQPLSAETPTTRNADSPSPSKRTTRAAQRSTSRQRTPASRKTRASTGSRQSSTALADREGSGDSQPPVSPTKTQTPRTPKIICPSTPESSAAARKAHVCGREDSQQARAEQRDEAAVDEQFQCQEDSVDDAVQHEERQIQDVGAAEQDEDHQEQEDHVEVAAHEQEARIDDPDPPIAVATHSQPPASPGSPSVSASLEQQEAVQTQLPAVEHQAPVEAGPSSQLRQVAATQPPMATCPTLLEPPPALDAQDSIEATPVEHILPPPSQPPLSLHDVLEKDAISSSIESPLKALEPSPSSSLSIQFSHPLTHRNIPPSQRFLHRNITDESISLPSSSPCPPSGPRHDFRLSPITSSSQRGDDYGRDGGDVIEQDGSQILQDLHAIADECSQPCAWQAPERQQLEVGMLSLSSEPVAGGVAQEQFIEDVAGQAAASHVALPDGENVDVDYAEPPADEMQQGVERPIEEDDGQAVTARVAPLQAEHVDIDNSATLVEEVHKVEKRPIEDAMQMATSSVAPSEGGHVEVDIEDARSSPDAQGQSGAALPSQPQTAVEHAHVLQPVVDIAESHGALVDDVQAEAAEPRATVAHGLKATGIVDDVAQQSDFSSDKASCSAQIPDEAPALGSPSDDTVARECGGDDGPVSSADADDTVYASKEQTAPPELRDEEHLTPKAAPQEDTQDFFAGFDSIDFGEVQLSPVATRVSVGLEQVGQGSAAPADSSVQERSPRRQFSRVATDRSEFDLEDDKFWEEAFETEHQSPANARAAAVSGAPAGHNEHDDLLPLSSSQLDEEAGLHDERHTSPPLPQAPPPGAFLGFSTAGNKKLAEPSKAAMQQAMKRHAQDDASASGSAEADIRRLAAVAAAKRQSAAQQQQTKTTSPITPKLTSGPSRTLAAKQAQPGTDDDDGDGSYYEAEPEPTIIPQFVSFAKANGRAVEVNKAALDKACRQMETWEAEHSSQVARSQQQQSVPPPSTPLARSRAPVAARPALGPVPTSSARINQNAAFEHNGKEGISRAQIPAQVSTSRASTASPLKPIQHTPARQISPSLGSRPSLARPDQRGPRISLGMTPRAKQAAAAGKTPFKTPFKASVRPGLATSPTSPAVLQSRAYPRASSSGASGSAEPTRSDAVQDDSGEQ